MVSICLTETATVHVQIKAETMQRHVMGIPYLISMFIRWREGAVFACNLPMGV